jgi:hypothetical protein
VRVTAVDTVVVNARLRNWVFVKVATDEPGLVGWGRRRSNGRRRVSSAPCETWPYSKNPLFMAKLESFAARGGGTR